MTPALKLRPDVVAMAMLELSGIEATRPLRAAGFFGGIAMLSWSNERRPRRSGQGVSGPPGNLAVYVRPVAGVPARHAARRGMDTTKFSRDNHAARGEAAKARDIPLRWLRSPFVNDSFFPARSYSVRIASRIAWVP